jgi:polygalacturonase
MSDPFVDIRDYGATGDPFGDDTAAIQAALLQAGKQGYGCVWIPSGTYVVCSTLTVDSRVVISGAGRGAIIRAKAPDFHIIQLNSRASGSRLTGFQIQGAAKADQMIGDKDLFAIFTDQASPPTNVTIDHLLI